MPVDVEASDEHFWYIFKGKLTPRGAIELDEARRGLSLTVDEEALKGFDVLE